MGSVLIIPCALEGSDFDSSTVYLPVQSSPFLAPLCFSLAFQVPATKKCWCHWETKWTSFSDKLGLCHEVVMQIMWDGTVKVNSCCCPLFGHTVASQVESMTCWQSKEWKCWHSVPWLTLWMSYSDPQTNQTILFPSSYTSWCPASKHTC